MTSTLVVSLRVVHVIAGAFWLGVMLMNAGFLLPAVQASGPAGGQVMKHLVQVRRLPSYLNGAVLITILTGGALLWWVSGGFSSLWLQSRTGIALLIGTASTVLAALCGQFVNAPTARRLGEVAGRAPAGGPPRQETVAEIGRRQRRLLRATAFAAALLVLAAMLMAAARYLG